MSKLVDLEGLKKVRQKLDDKYVIEGEYSPETSVGHADKADIADNLSPYSDESGVKDSTPFNFQTAGGESEIGAIAYLRELRGNSVRFNQIVKNGNFASLLNWSPRGDSTLSVSNGELTITAGATPSITGAEQELDQGVLIKEGHKYLICCNAQSTTSQAGFYIKIYSGNKADYILESIHFNTSGYRAGIYTATENGGGSSDQAYIQVIFARGGGTQLNQEGDTLTISNFMIIDLTAIYGVGKEPTGVGNFNKDFPLPYYDFTVGKLISSKSNGYKTVGYNAYDNSNPNDFIRVVSGQTYTLEGNGTVALYDYDKNLLSNTFVSESALPNNCCYVKITSGDNTTCFHLTWDGTKIGYEPYNSKTIALPNLELKSVRYTSFNRISSEVYDELKPDGTLITRTYKVTVGQTEIESLENQTQFGTNFFGITLPVIGKNSTGCVFNKDGLDIRGTSENTGSNAGYYYIYARKLYFNLGTNNTTTITQFLTGLEFIMILADETTTEDDDYKFQETQEIDNWGTQEYLSATNTSSNPQCPQGCYFFYPVDYKAFIDSLGDRQDINYDASKIVSQAELQVAIPYSQWFGTQAQYDILGTYDSNTIYNILES